MILEFYKYQATGNDFIIIDNRENNYQFSNSDITQMTNRKNIGCDQFIVLKASNKADIFMETPCDRFFTRLIFATSSIAFK